MIPAARPLATALACAVLITTSELPGCGPASLAAQEAQVSFGAGLLSRYVWRGLKYSDAVQAQPWVQINLGSFELGTWGSYSLDGEHLEQSQWVTWTRSLPQGSLEVAVADYFFTEDFRNFFDWGGVEAGVATGAHTLEAIVAYEGPAEHPVGLLLSSMLYNDPTPSVYAEAEYALNRVGSDWAAQVGGLLHDGLLRARERRAHEADPIRVPASRDMAVPAGARYGLPHPQPQAGQYASRDRGHPLSPLFRRELRRNCGRHGRRRQIRTPRTERVARRRHTG